jgi:hypothetical protein
MEGVLGDVGDTQVGVLPHHPVGGLCLTGQHLDEGGLASAVGANASHTGGQGHLQHTEAAVTAAAADASSTSSQLSSTIDQQASSSQQQILLPTAGKEVTSAKVFSQLQTRLLTAEQKYWGC